MFFYRIFSAEDTRFRGYKFWDLTSKFGALGSAYFCKAGGEEMVELRLSKGVDCLVGKKIWKKLENTPF